MSIKSQGGVFGRNPTFNDVTVEGDLSIDGTLSVGGETITGLSYQGGWNASTNTPDIAASSPVTGQFWIVSADGATNVGGITNWTSGDWALYDGTNWQRVEGGNTDLTTGVQGQLAVANGGTGAADAATALSNLGAATAAQGALADSAIQAADLGTAAYTASTDYATAAQGSLADSAVQPAAIANMLETTDIGSTVQGYDADTAKLDTAQTWSATQSFGDNIRAKFGASDDLQIYHDGSHSYIKEGGTGDLRLLGTNFRVKNSADTQSMIVGSDNGGVYLYHAGVQKLLTTSTGIDVTGNVALSSGSGIDFSATSGTGTSELLDDYEEGTWTPAFAASTGTFTHTTQYGVYTKVGRQVNVQFRVKATCSGGSTAQLRIQGLPFTTSATSSDQIHVGTVGYVTGFVTPTYSNMVIYSGSNSTSIYLWWTDYTSADNLKSNDVPSSGGVDITGSLTYFV